MNTPQSSFSVNVDVTNPGQFFACCGLLELAHRLWPGAEGWFGEGSFSLATLGKQNILPMDLLDLLIRCDVDLASERASDPKTAPLELGPPISMRLDWWLKDDGKPNLFKTWAANASAQQMFCKWRRPLKENLATFAADTEHLLAVTTRQQGSYGFDSELGWDALNVGFSLNEHAGLKQLPTHPAVELLGAIGLQRFFPVFKEKEQVVEYVTWRAPLNASVACVAAVGRLSVVTMQRLRTRFVFRGSFKGLDQAINVQGDMYE